MFTVHTMTVVGIEPQLVAIDATVDAYKFPAFDVGGMPELSVRETRVRVRSAIRQAGLTYPAGDITVIADPQDLRKEGTHYDLPMALAILGAADFPHTDLGGYIVAGELSLTGAVRSVTGVLAMAQYCAERSYWLICPVDNVQEALAVLPPDRVRPAETLGQVVQCLAKAQPWPAVLPQLAAPPSPHRVDWADVRGHVLAKRALEVAAAGGYNVLLVGTPGTGKTMLARRVPTILPPLERQEAIETTTLWSVAGLLPNGAGLLRERPFRAPHHTCSASALVGGGSTPKPGEVSLAHNGVLMLDELPELPRHVIESLREAIETGAVTVCRARQTARFPARVMVVAAMIPCPCGHVGSAQYVCTCSAESLRRYNARLSAWFTDTAMRVDLSEQTRAMLTGGPAPETSAKVQARVTAARARMTDRWGSGQTARTVSLGHLEATHAKTKGAEAVLQRCLVEWTLTGPVYEMLVRLSSTIADLGGSTDALVGTGLIEAEHVAEASHYIKR